MTRSTDWTDAQTNKLVALYRKGETYSTIARALLPLGKAITSQAVGSKVKTLGLTRDRSLIPWQPDEKARLAELLAEGKTDEAIAMVMAAEFPGRRVYNRNVIGGSRARRGMAKKAGRQVSTNAETVSEPAPAPERQGCKWVTNATALHRQRPHYCGMDAAGDWCKTHKAVLHGREVGV